MSLFVCDKCGCVENTALGRYWSKDMPFWGDDNRGLALCSECAPTRDKDGNYINEYGARKYGKWHGIFLKEPWDGVTKVINRKLSRKMGAI